MRTDAEQESVSGVEVKIQFSVQCVTHRSHRPPGLHNALRFCKTELSRMGEKGSCSLSGFELAHPAGTLPGAHNVCRSILLAKLPRLVFLAVLWIKTQ